MNKISKEPTKAVRSEKVSIKSTRLKVKIFCLSIHCSILMWAGSELEEWSVKAEKKNYVFCLYVTFSDLQMLYEEEVSIWIQV